MALVLCLGSALLMATSGWVLSGSSSRSQAVLATRAMAWAHRCHRLVDLLASSALMAMLLERPTFASCAREFQEKAAGRSLRMSSEVAGVALLLGIGGTTVLAGLMSRSMVGAVVCALALLVAMRAHVASQKRKRKAQLAAAMPGVLRTMATALASGQTLMQAIEYVGLHEQGPVSEAFARASLRLHSGISLNAALNDLREELDAPGVDLMVSALSVSQRTGSPLRGLLQQAAELVEQQEEFARLLMVRTAQVRLSIRIVCCLPPLMVLVLALLSPDFQQGILSPVGLGSLILAAALDGIALLVVRHIMRGVL